LSLKTDTMNHGPTIISWNHGKRNLYRTKMTYEHTEYRHHLDQSLSNTAPQLRYPLASFNIEQATSSHLSGYLG
jgi:hypothetical protein